MLRNLRISPSQILALLALAMCLRLGAALPTDSPESFFANVADRLLQQQFGLRLREVQIAPTNQYDSAVHRIFQITANIYDATRTNEFPTVFRPLFNVTSNGVFLAGFTNDNRVSTLQSWLDSNPYGIPMVIAARKDIPNFNEFTMRTDFLMQRKLQLTRTNNTPGTRPNGTNQMYMLSVSNFFGVEAWNPYEFTKNARPVTFVVSNSATLWMSNNLGMQTNASITFAAETNIAANTWRGGLSSFAFVLPLFTNDSFLDRAVYHFEGNVFENSPTNVFETFPGFPLPYWICSVSNRLTFVFVADGCVIDFVLLDAGQTTDLYQDLIGTNPYSFFVPAAIAQVWSTNHALGSNDLTDGIRRQLDIGLGSVPTSLSDWRSLALSAVTTTAQKAALIDSFRSFCGLFPLSGTPFPTNTSLAMETPFNPAAKLSVIATRQANDPTVHHHGADLIISFNPTSRIYLKPSQPSTNLPPSSLGLPNYAYSPWGGNPRSTDQDPSVFDRSIRDPGIYSPDDWNFPTNEALSSRWLGRIHRGTPWQTIYLKADVAPMLLWTNQSSDFRTHPTNDWRLVALLASLLNTSDVRTLTSINTTNIGEWTSAFSGLTVLSNAVTTPILGAPVTYETNIVAADAPQVATVIAAIERERTVRRGEYFANVSDLLSVPELSSASPWLNLTGDQPKWGITDEGYEILPSQLLALVRADPVGTTTVNGTIYLHFTAGDGLAYRVESTSDFASWTTVSEPHFSTNGVFCLSVTPTNGMRFFRAVDTGE